MMHVDICSSGFECDVPDPVVMNYSLYFCDACKAIPLTAHNEKGAIGLQSFNFNSTPFHEPPPFAIVINEIIRVYANLTTYLGKRIVDKCIHSFHYLVMYQLYSAILVSTNIM